MAEISIELYWKLEDKVLEPGKYSNKHEIKLNSDITIIGDAAPDWNGNSKYNNPEQTLAASLSSCHMMTFLALAAKMSWPVQSYSDKAVATLGKNSQGKMSVINIELNPKVEFSEDFTIGKKEIKEVQERAHRYCFIANSLSKEVQVKIN